MDLYDHQEYLALCQAVRANPDCDLPRRVVADWLRENGDEDRATYIQCELAVRADQPRKCQRNGFPLAWESGGSGRYPGPLYRPHCRCGTCSTIRRAYLSSRRHIRVTWEGRVVKPAHRRNMHATHFPGPIHFGWNRGFIERVSVLWVRDWLEFGPLAVREHPVRWVDFDRNGCRPYIMPSDPNADIPLNEWDAVWFEEDDHPAGPAPWELPSEIYKLLPRRHFPFAEFNDAETPVDAAESALSEACLKWADQKCRAGTESQTEVKHADT